MQEWEKPKETYKRKRFGPIIAMILLVAAVFVQGRGCDRPIENAGFFSMHVLDVGQASATLIVSGSHAMMIDTGNRDDAGLIQEYLKEQNVEKLDYLLFTHPHEDHIGAGAALLRENDVDRVIMPDIPLDMCPTASYADLLAAIEEKEPVTDYPKVGDVYTLGEISFTIVAPLPEQPADAENLNESSLGVLITAGENKALIYGDGEQACEQYMVANHDIEADVLVVAHHGSNSGTGNVLLEAVNPEYAIISCGRDNDYGYPHTEVLERLGQRGIEIYRTDLQGHIFLTGNGKNISFFNGNFRNP